MEYLQKHELHLVDPKLRHVVEEAWENGELVPRSVVLVSVPDVQKVKELIAGLS